nr:hypothetical protein Iba_chr06aCG6060 [Ipomoea batatas]
MPRRQGDKRIGIKKGSESNQQLPTVSPLVKTDLIQKPIPGKPTHMLGRREPNKKISKRTDSLPTPFPRDELGRAFMSSGFSFAVMICVVVAIEELQTGVESEEVVVVVDWGSGSCGGEETRRR